MEFLPLYFLSNPLLDAYRGSDFFGKLIFLGLLGLSILTWVIFIQKFLLQRRVRLAGKNFLQAFLRKQENPLSMEVAISHPFASLYRALKLYTLELLKKNRGGAKEDERVFLSHADIESLESHLLHASSQEIKEIEKNLFFLSTTITLAPFLGLLGTVWGILMTFNQLKSHSVSASPEVLGGLAMALGTTVFGLLVAIPALIAYNYLRTSMTELTEELDHFSHTLVSKVELHYREVETR